LIDFLGESSVAKDREAMMDSQVLDVSIMKLFVEAFPEE